MSKKHQKVLSAIFSDHLSSNIHWKEIESLLIYLGAEFRESSGASLVAIINGIEFSMHRGHHNTTMSKKSLHQLRKYLESLNIRNQEIQK
ncbi:MAG: type II toxin-antitoxin system HicA family toxin [Gammaproteobacteria bacterium]|nr:MAG: type II toxin-antitoxin system HicA family toxin [Gammaproteobacteria bacterium]